MSLWAPELIQGYLGDGFSDAVPIVRLGLLASVPLAAFYAARPALDAIQSSPVTVKLMIGSLVLEVVVTILAGRMLAPVYAAVLGLDVAMAFLGILSYVALLAATRGAQREAG